MSEAQPVIRVVKADITTLAVDAILNAVNTSLLGGDHLGCILAILSKIKRHDALLTLVFMHQTAC